MPETEGVHIDGPLHVCETCDVKHYDNCPTCFGFGVRAALGVRIEADGEPVPLSAQGAEQFRAVGPMPGDMPFAPCPTCKSSPWGIPTDA